MNLNLTNEQSEESNGLKFNVFLEGPATHELMTDEYRMFHALLLTIF